MISLREIGQIFRAEQTDYKELTNAIDDFEALVIKISDFDDSSRISREDIKLGTGKALGTTWAALCIRDILRTKMFVKGLFEAIDHVKKSNKLPVHILYVGSGPFATLILPILATYPPSEVICTIMEINDVSFNSVTKVIHALGFDDHVKNFIKADATKYYIEDADQIDIILSETMQRALEREQQVPIMMHLLPQLKKDVVMIPENISLELVLMNRTVFSSRTEATPVADYFFHLGAFFELNAQNIYKYQSLKANASGKLEFPEKTFVLPFEKFSYYNELTILTEIQIFGQNRLMVNQSGLTTPLNITNLRYEENDIRTTIYYKVDEQPGFEYRKS